MKNFLGFQRILSSSKVLRGLILMISFILLPSCASTDVVSDIASRGNAKAQQAFFPKDGRMDFDISQGIVIYRDAKIYLSDLQINVAANRPLETKPKVLFVPLGLVQSSVENNGISYGVSRILWQQFLAEQTFSVLEFAENSPPYRVEYAVERAKSLGADFLVGGYITHFLDGASVGDSKIAIQLEIYDTETGALLWAINQSGVLPYKTDQNNIIFKVHNRMPIDAMSTLVSAIGANIATYLHYWTDPKAMAAKKALNPSIMEKLEPKAF